MIMGPGRLWNIFFQTFNRKIPPSFPLAIALGHKSSQNHEFTQGRLIRFKALGHCVALIAKTFFRAL